ncbi:unnamed protein product [Mytilus coruscus]|uniref:SSD domain-containing protein n=1 Tax=Mytilus coruscus TaxID=42192 RepID=A0A6J8C9N4_MYTCO|nr:unnamed protein product [Mytilus coruscus]
MGTNCVDNRYYLGLAGVLSTCVAIMAAFGLVSVCGAEFVDIVGIMPFFNISSIQQINCYGDCFVGIGVDDMFILLSCLADTNCKDSIENRIGTTLKHGGTAITITSLTDIIAFCAGAASVFPSVRNFSWYTGCAVLSETDYRLASNVLNIISLLKKARDDRDVVDNFQLSWLDSYMKSSDFNDTTHSDFILGLQKFLNTNSGNMFVNDVTIEGSSITASRFHVLSNSLTESSNQASLMILLRDLTKSSHLPVFVFSPTFIVFEQYVQIVPQTIQTLAIAVSVVFLVTAIFMPLPVLILLVTISVSMIMVGVIGLMEIWGLTLSSVTMIHIVMCVGFSVDFSAHICHAYAHCPGEDRHFRVATAMDMAGGPILNGVLSSLIGIVVLAFSQSYIFFSFFKVMSIVVVAGAMHAIFRLLVLLCLIGPIYGPPVTNPENNKAVESTGHKTSVDRKQSGKESNDTENDKYNDLMSYKMNTIPRLSAANIREIT